MNEWWDNQEAEFVEQNQSGHDEGNGANDMT